MAKVAFGLEKIEKGNIDPVTGLPTGLLDVGDIYRDTASMETADGETTDHFAELKQSPVITITEMGTQTLRFQLMDTSAAKLLEYMGGTVTEVAGEPDVWNAPRDIVAIEKAFVITTKDGTVFTIHRGKVVGKLIVNPTRKDVSLLDVMIRVLNPNVDALAPITVADPAV